MARLRIFILLLAMWVIVLFNIERFDPLNFNLPSTLYIIAAIGLLPVLLIPITGQIRFQVAVVPILVIYVALRYFEVISPVAFTIPGILTEGLILTATLWIGHKISVNLESFEKVVDDVLFEHEGNRILSMTDGEEAVNNELFRARKYERPVALLYVKLPSIARLRRIYPDTFQYQLSLEQRYYKSRIARIVESMVYRVDIMVWYGDNLVICLPETELEQAEQLATQISEIISSSIILQVPMGVATFPNDGLIYQDLVAHAEKHLKVYEDKNDGDQTNSKQPEAQDDPMTMTVPSRVGTGNLASVSALRRVQNALSHALVMVTSDINLMPTARFHMAHDDAVRPYYDPDYWVNRIPPQSTSSRWIYERIKRLIDITAVLVTMPFLLTVGMAVALAIKLEDGGKVLFSQPRTGLGGRKFQMYKFRSMVENAEKRLKELGVTVNERGETVDANGNKLTYDPRVTRVGRFIRKTSLDELPQLWNVLRGDMSLVGPRPTSFGVDKYQLYHTQRLSVKPGITGLWQIHDRGDTDFDNRLVWDIKYIDKFSLIMDVNILMRTLNAVIKKKGAR